MHGGHVSLIKTLASKRSLFELVNMKIKADLRYPSCSIKVTHYNNIFTKFLNISITYWQ